MQTMWQSQNARYLGGFIKVKPMKAKMNITAYNTLIHILREKGIQIPALEYEMSKAYDCFYKKNELRKMKIADEILSTIITIRTTLKTDPELAEELEEECRELQQVFKRKGGEKQWVE
jgi:hypothetical protein